MKTLETERLVLRLFKDDDLYDFNEYAKVEGVGERAGWFHHRSLEESKRVLTAFMEQKDTFAVVLRENQKVIGSIGLHNRENNPKVLEIGYVLSKDYWGKGLMTEAVSKVIEYCFKELGLEAITCGHFVENRASQRVIEKMGFQFVEAGKYYSKNMDREFDHRKYLLTNERYTRIQEDKALKSMSNDERWRLFPITLTDHSKHWSEWYRDMEKRLLDKLGSLVVRVSHIGSTAIEGLIAKPTIDILLEIAEDTELESFKISMDELGLRYHNQPDNAPPHMMFTKGYSIKGYEDKVFHIHVRYLGDWDELYFRDYLNDEVKVKKAYENLKIELARLFKYDRNRYTDAKTDFIREASRKARLKYGYIYKKKD